MAKNFKKRIMVVALAFTLAFAGSSAKCVSVDDCVNVTNVKAKSTVYYAEHSVRYHVNKNCRTLKRSRNIYKTTKKKAKAMGLTKCKVCSR